MVAIDMVEMAFNLAERICVVEQLVCWWYGCLMNCLQVLLPATVLSVNEYDFLVLREDVRLHWGPLIFMFIQSRTSCIELLQQFTFISDITRCVIYCVWGWYIRLESMKKRFWKPLCLVLWISNILRLKFCCWKWSLEKSAD